jgi:DNA repair exonuclease SbcCD ATPase subunit
MTLMQSVFIVSSSHPPAFFSLSPPTSTVESHAEEIQELRAKLSEGKARMLAARADLADTREKLRLVELQASEKEALLTHRCEELRERLEHAGETAVASVTSATTTVVTELETRVAALQAREAELASAVDALDATVRTKDSRIASLTAELADAETRATESLAAARLCADRATAAEAALAAEQGAIASRVAELQRSLAVRAAECETLAAARDTDVKERSRAQARAVTLEAQLAQRRTEMERWLQDMARLRAEEERAFRDLQAEREETDLLRGMVARLQREAGDNAARVKDLTEENARLVGHTNANQKIQHHLQVKIENNNLRERITELSADLARKDRICARLAKLSGGAAATNENAGAGAANSVVTLAGSKVALPFDDDAEEALRVQLAEARASHAEAAKQIAAEVGRAMRACGVTAPAALEESGDFAAQIATLRRLAGIVEEKAKENVELERALRDAEFKETMQARTSSLAS